MFLRRWWTEKYKLPWTNPAFQESTTLELLTEYFEDDFEKHPNELLKAGKNEDGEIVFEETGDPIIDKWEREIAMGIEPDLTEGMNAADIAALDQEQAKYSRARQGAREVSPIDQRIEDAIKKDPRFASKNSGQLGMGGPVETDVLSQILGTDK